jgi:hypothetical protein
MTLKQRQKKKKSVRAGLNVLCGAQRPAGGHRAKHLHRNRCAVLNANNDKYLEYRNKKSLPFSPALHDSNRRSEEQHRAPSFSRATFYNTKTHRLI